MEVKNLIEENGGVRIETPEGIYGFYGIREDIIRSVYSKKEIKEESLLIEEEARRMRCPLEIEECGEGIWVSAGKLKVFWDKKTGNCTWMDALSGRVY